MSLSQAIVPFLLIDALGPLYYSEFNITTGWDALLLPFDFFLIFEHGERSHQFVYNIRDLNGLLLYILRLGYGFSFLFYIIAGRVGWWVGSEFYSLSIYREISYSGVFASLFISLYHDKRVSAGKVGLLSFLICPKEQFYKFCSAGRFFLFHGARLTCGDFSPCSLFCTGRVGQLVRDIFGEHAFEFLYLI